MPMPIIPRVLWRQYDWPIELFFKELKSTRKDLDKLNRKYDDAQNQLQYWETTEGERKSAEIALRESEDRFRNVVNNVLEYIYSTEYVYGDLTSTFHSPRCKDITGYTSEEYLENPDLPDSKVITKEKVFNNVLDILKF